MKFKIQLFSEESCNASMLTEIAVLDRACKAVEDVGLTLAEAKALLAEIQTQIAQAQIAEYLEDQRSCANCGGSVAKWTMSATMITCALSIQATLTII